MGSRSRASNVAHSGVCKIVRADVTGAQTAIRDSRIASVWTKTKKLFYPRIAFSIAAEARPRGSPRFCSHSCRVRFEICSRSAASLCEKSFSPRHARSRVDSSAPADFRCRVCRGCVPKLIWSNAIRESRIAARLLLALMIRRRPGDPTAVASLRFPRSASSLYVSHV